MADLTTPEIEAALKATGHNLQKFTTAEQACISGAISKGIDEGKDMDQAVAIAISECAPEKSEASLAHNASVTSGDERDNHVHPVPELDENGNGKTGMAQGAESEPHAHDVQGFIIQDFDSGRGYVSKHSGSLRIENAQASLTELDEIPGGRYTAIDNGDGTFDILDVPIVAELTKGEKNTPFDIGRAWHLMALSTNQRREAEGHMAPLKIHHPELGAKRPERAGFVSLTRVGTVRMDGKTMSALFARLRRITAEAFLKIQNIELPYRSVEANWTEFEIDALALLDSEVPFHRMQMLTIGQVEKASVSALNENKFALAYCSLGDKPGSGAALFNLGPIPIGVKTMADVKKDAKGKLAGHTDEDEDKDKEKSLEDRVVSMETNMATMQDGMNTMNQTLQEIVKRLPEKKDDEEDDEEAKAKAAAADDAAPVEALSKDPKTAATLAAQRTTINAMKKERATEKLLEKALKGELANYKLDEESMTMLTACANQGEGAMKQFIGVFTKNVEPETPKDEAALEMENAVSSMSTDAKAFCKENGDTPEMKSEVATAEAEYKLYVEHTGTKLSLKDWLESKQYMAAQKA